MSKKNNKGTKRRLYAADLEREKQELEKRQKTLDKKQQRQQQQQQNGAGTTAGVKAGVKKKKPIRLRKGVRVKGIKVVDSETKNKVRQLLKAEAAMAMDVDDTSKGAKKKGSKSSGLKGALKGIKGLGKTKKEREEKKKKGEERRKRAAESAMAE